MTRTAYTLAYDYDGQLTSITQGASSVTYGYDALGRRQGRTTGGVTTNFNWGMKGIDIETQGSTVVAQSTYGLFLVDRWSASAPNYSEYPLYDWQGSVRFGTSWPGTNFSAVYDGFGQVVTSAGNTYDPYLFAGASGYRNDQDAGLVHVGARYYDAQVGRFITRDTDLSQKPYQYCEHDPVNCLDPSGHDPNHTIGTIGGIIAIIGVGLGSEGLAVVGAALTVGMTVVDAGEFIGKPLANWLSPIPESLPPTNTTYTIMMRSYWSLPPPGYRQGAKWGPSGVGGLYGVTVIGGPYAGRYVSSHSPNDDFGW